MSISVRELVHHIFQQMGLEERYQQQRVIEGWRDISGPHIAKHSWPVAVREKVLVVVTENHVWAQELSLRRGELLSRITALVGTDVIHDIRFRSRDPGKAARKRRTGTPDPTASRVASLSLSEEQHRRLHLIAGVIRDPDVREAAERALISLAKQRLWWQQQGWRPCTRCGRLHRRPRAVWCVSCATAPKHHQ